MKKISEIIDGAKNIAVGGHIRPDGDCIGACLGLYNYVKNNYPEVSITLYLEEIPEKFSFLKERVIEAISKFDISRNKKALQILQSFFCF